MPTKHNDKNEKDERKEERRAGMHRYTNGKTREVWSDEDRTKWKENFERIRPYLDHAKDVEQQENTKSQNEELEKKKKSKWDLPLIS